MKALLAGLKRDLLLAREQMAKDPPGMARMIGAIKAGVERDFQPSLGERAAAQAGLQAGVNGVITALARIQQADLNALAVARDNLKAALDNLSAAAYAQRSQETDRLALVREAQADRVLELLAADEFRDQEWLGDEDQIGLIGAKAREREISADKMEALRTSWPLEFTKQVEDIIEARVTFAIKLLLDLLQLSLVILGFVDIWIPYTPFTVGMIADGINALISLARGNYVDATINAISAVPFAGWATKGGKWIAAGADAMGDITRIGRKLDNGLEAAAALAAAVRRGDSACDIATLLGKHGVPDWITVPLRKFGCFEAGTLVILGEDFGRQITSQQSVSHGLVLDQRA